MKVTSSGIVNGYFKDKYGKYGSQKNKHGKATCSIPFTIEDAPDGTKSFAAVLYDMDDVPVSGFPWIHWTLCNLTDTTVKENASLNHPDFIQGSSTFHSIACDETLEEGSCYGGMAPEGGDHEYTLIVYALDCMLNLEKGFFLNHLLYAMEGHILEKAVLKANYRD